MRNLPLHQLPLMCNKMAYPFHKRSTCLHNTAPEHLSRYAGWNHSPTGTGFAVWPQYNKEETREEKRDIVVFSCKRYYDKKVVMHDRASISLIYHVCLCTLRDSLP